MMTDINAQIQQLEAAKSLLSSHGPEVLAQVVDAVSKIIIANQDVPILKWCLDFIQERTEPRKEQKFESRKLVATEFLNSFCELHSKHTKSCSDSSKVCTPLLHSDYLLKTLITVSINIYGICAMDLINNNEKSVEIWEKQNTLKLFILNKWDLVGAKLDNLKEARIGSTIHDAQKANQNIIIKLNIIRFVFRIIDFQTQLAPIDPRKRRQRSQKEESVESQVNSGSSPDNENEINFQKLSITMVPKELVDYDGFFKESHQLLTIMLDIFTNYPIICSQIFTAISFSIIKLIQNRPHLAKKVIGEIVGLKIENKLPVECEIFESTQSDPKNQFYKLKFKMERRNCYRALKILIDFLFKNQHLNAFVKKSQPQGLETGVLSKHDENSLKLLDKINYILHIQHQERITKNLQLDLEHDYFTKVDQEFYNREVLRKARLIEQNKTPEKISYSDLFSRVGPSKPFLFDLSTISQDILANIVLIALGKTDARLLNDKLEALSQQYSNIYSSRDRKRQNDDHIDNFKRFKRDV